MPSETAYKGRTIRLMSIQNTAGRWVGRVQLPDESDRVLEVEEEFATQEEAQKAALSRAISEIDSERRFRGKP